MNLIELQRRGILRAPDELTSGGEPVPEPIAEPEPIVPPQYDFNDPVLQQALAQQAADLANTQFNDWKADFTRNTYVPPQQPYLPPPSAVPKTPAQLKQERMQAIMSQETWQDQVGVMVDLIEQAETQGAARARAELQPLLQHSTIQTGTSKVLKNATDVDPSARPYIEDMIETMGFSPVDLEKPQNAQLVADAAYARALRAGKVTGQPAPAANPTQGGNLFNAPARTPVPAAAPVVGGGGQKTWREGLNAQQQAEIDQTLRTYTPPGMKPEDVFPQSEIDNMVATIKYRDSMPNF